jgi:uncharacterized membrane protein
MVCQFWLEDFSCLFKNISLFPDQSQNEAERLNSMTWIIIIVSLLLFGFRIQYWWLFLLIGLFLVFILYLSWKPYISSSVSHYTCAYKHFRNKNIQPKLNLKPYKN